MKIISSGDSAILCHFGNKVDKALSETVIALHLALIKAGIRGYIESVPSYTGLMVYYDTGRITQEEISAAIEEQVGDLMKEPSHNDGILIKVPVAYGGAYGPDLEYVANINKLSAQELISIHSEKPYRVYMLGFTPGFPYLGGIDRRIATPRKETPRLKIKAGSVGIAGDQTGIYPLESPGGWQIIGKTPLKLFDFTLKNPFLFSPGNYIKFDPVSLDEYFQIAEQLKSGKYIAAKEIMK